MSPVHPTARAGWQGAGAEDYEAGRPGYPREAVRRLGRELGIGPGDTVLDLAAGTGKLTRELSALGPGVTVIAVEPMAAMRAQLAAAVPGVEVREGTAEAIPVPDGSVRAVFVAQAFHWFDVPAAAAEIARVLTTDGGLAIVRNEWTERGPLAELRDYLRRHAAVPATHGRDWPAELDATGRFTRFTEETVRHEQDTDLTGVLRRLASMSFVAALPEAERADLLAGARTRLQARGLRDGQPLHLPITARLRWARRR